MKFGVLRGYVFAVWHFWCEGRCQLEGVFLLLFFFIPDVQLIENNWRNVICKITRGIQG